MNLTEQFKNTISRPSNDCDAYICKANEMLKIMTFLRDQAGYSMLVDLTAVDNGVDASPRFTVVYHVLNMAEKKYLRLVVDCNGDENPKNPKNPKIPSVASVYSAANWHERETYDMFGICFVNHPDLRRILMWDEYPHYPLRKEFPLAGIDTDYPEADVVERTGVRVLPAPMAGGPFVASGKGAMSDKEPRAKDQSWRETHRKD
jgi:NADH-quinone oxidoreductase subunit C